MSKWPTTRCLWIVLGLAAGAGPLPARAAATPTAPEPVLEDRYPPQIVAFPAAIRDVKLAIRWLRVNARGFGIDASSVIVWGASAGGQLAGLAATSCGKDALAPEPASGTAASGPPWPLHPTACRVRSSGTEFST
jgi:hypothetical protein